MGRRVNAIKHMAETRERFARLRIVPDTRVRGNRRPRDEESKRLISMMVRDRWENWLKAGIVEILGPRRIRINLPKPGQPLF